MPVDVEFLNFGTPAVTSFADTFATASANPLNTMTPPNSNWIQTLLGGNSPTAGCEIGTFLAGAALPSGGGNGLQIGGLSYAFTTYSMATGIIPYVAYVGTTIYKAQQKFCQITFNNGTNVSCGIGVGNFLDLSGTGSGGNQQINHDAYIMFCAASSPFNTPIQRFNSGAGVSTLVSPGNTVAQGDVLRISFDFTNSAQVSITTKQNGTVVSSIVDNAANRVTQAGSFPFIAIWSFGAGPTAGLKNFSCGVGL